MCTLSVTIPVYNAAPFIEECLHSVLRQTIVDLEVICINDGSTDGSLEILKRLSQQDKRLIILDQKNQGVSVARNTGLKIAKGEYVGFVDADDWIEPDYFEKFLAWKGKDLVSSTLSKTLPFEKNKIYRQEAIQNEIYPFMLGNSALNSVWAKIFKNEIIQKHQLRFQLGKKLGEDYHFILSFLQYAQELVLIENTSYQYRENPESATRIVKDDAFFKSIFNDFEFDYKKIYHLSASEDLIKEQKSKLLIKSFIANLSMFLRKNPYLDFSTRKGIVKKYMKDLKQTGVLDNEKIINTLNKGFFNKWILNALKQESFFKINMAYQYSHWRNGIK